MKIPLGYIIFGVVGTLAYLIYLVFAYRKDLKDFSFKGKEVFLFFVLFMVLAIAVWAFKEMVTR